MKKHNHIVLFDHHIMYLGTPYTHLFEGRSPFDLNPHEDLLWFMIQCIRKYRCQDLIDGCLRDSLGYRIYYGVDQDLTLFIKNKLFTTNNLPNNTAISIRDKIYLNEKT